MEERNPLRPGQIQVEVGRLLSLPLELVMVNKKNIPS